MWKKLFILAFLLTIVTIVTSGCESVEEDPESELPWTTPEPWEGQILPTLSQ